MLSDISEIHRSSVLTTIGTVMKPFAGYADSDCAQEKPVRKSVTGLGPFWEKAP